MCCVVSNYDRSRVKPPCKKTPETEMPPNSAELQPARPQSPMRPQSPLRIKQDGKFYERLLTKESSGGNPSFRYYWAEPGSVPFVWESQPGTPRDASRMGVRGALPAITPPPSYLLRHGGRAKVQAVVTASASRHPKVKAKGKRRYRFKRIKVGFIAGIFRRLALGNPCLRSSSAPPSVQASSSSSRWLFSSVAPAERAEQQQRHTDQNPASRKIAAAPCSGSRQLSPWMQRLRCLANRSRDED